MCGVQSSAVDENEKEGRGKEGQTWCHEPLRNAETNPAECYPKKEYGGICYPYPWTEKLKQRQIEEVGSRRLALKEVLEDAFTRQHTLGVDPKVDLISTQQKGNVGEGEKVDVKV